MIFSYWTDRENFNITATQKNPDPLKTELGNPPEGSQVLSKDQDLRDPPKYCLTHGKEHMPEALPTRQAGLEYSQSDTYTKVYRQFPVWNLLSISVLVEN